MNLKTFAVSQKLHRDQKLLDYVVHEQAVPLNVIQDAFGPLLETQTDVKAERLITNIRHCWQMKFRFGFTKMQRMALRFREMCRIPC